MAKTPQNQNYSNLILGEQVQLLYKQTWGMLGINLLVGAAFVIGMSSAAPTTHLYIWYFSLVAIFTIRLGIYYLWLNKRHQASWTFFAHVFTVGAFVNALAWATASVWFFHPEKIEYQLLIISVLTGMGAGSVSSMYMYMPAFFAYFLTASIPLVFCLLYQGGKVYITVSALIFIFISFLCYFALRINKTYIDSLKVRHQNRILLDELRDQKEEAERANQSKSKFLAAASHDLRQPLHALNLYASILAGKISEAKNKKLVDQIVHSIDALQSLFNALLDISKLEAGTLIPERRNFRLQPILKHIVSDFDNDALEKGIQLSVNCEDILCYSDAAMIEQVVRNYLSNAIRYTKEGSISVGAKLQQDTIQISVTDSGIGIPTDQLDAIYDEFYQLSNPERDRSKGLGLGLAIVQRISRLLGHKISVESNCGKGSTFSIFAPAGSATSFTDLPKTSNEWVQGKVDTQLNIVVIDDDVDVRESTAELFTSWGCTVFAGSTPQDVLEKLNTQHAKPDAIIADYRLRGGRTGIGAIDLIKAQYSEEIPALIITGDTASEPLRAIQSSGIPLLNKPVSPAKFRLFLNSVLPEQP